RLQIKGYAIGASKPGGPVPHAHLIVDNEPALEIDDAVPWALGGLSPGPHILRAVLCRPWHEVGKAPKAFAMVRLWIGPRHTAMAAAGARNAPDRHRAAEPEGLAGDQRDQRNRPRVHRRVTPAQRAQVQRLTMSGRPFPPACRPSPSPGSLPT